MNAAYELAEITLRPGRGLVHVRRHLRDGGNPARCGERDNQSCNLGSVSPRPSVVAKIACVAKWRRGSTSSPSTTTFLARGTLTALPVSSLLSTNSVRVGFTR